MGSELSRKPRFIPLRFKLLFSYMFLVIIPVIVIGSYSYVSSVRSIEEHARSNLDVAVEQIKRNFEYRAADVVRSSEEVYADQVLSRYLSGYYLDWEKYQITTQYVLPRLERATNLPAVNIRLSVYLNSPIFSEYYYTETEDALRSGDRQYGLFYTSRIRSEVWFSSLKLGFDELVWKQVGSDFEYDNISLLRPLINYETFSTIGLIKTTVRKKDIFEDADSNRLDKGSQLFIIDANEEILYSSSLNSMKYNKDLLMAKDEYLIIQKPLDNMPATIVALIPNSAFQENSERVRNITVLICLMSLAVLTLISFIISKYFSKRIIKLLVSLRAFKEGEFQRRIHYRGNDEFSLISDAFNEMASTIQGLIDEVYISKLEKKEAELQILHFQMNPHFLYNTFSSISRMAKLGEIEKLHEIIRALAKFYRLTLNKGEMVIPIGKEIEIIQAYLQIQNIKHGDRIEVIYEIDEEILNLETVKFILQPFVENVLEHAWYDDFIRIRIRGYLTGETVTIEVIDNGLGMREETIEGIFGESGTAIGYGIRNVDQRIKLHYGKEFGVSIASAAGEGTAVRITLPEVECAANLLNNQN